MSPLVSLSKKSLEFAIRNNTQISIFLRSCYIMLYHSCIRDLTQMNGSIFLVLLVLWMPT